MCKWLSSNCLLEKWAFTLSSTIFKIWKPFLENRQLIANGHPEPYTQAYKAWVQKNTLYHQALPLCFLLIFSSLSGVRPISSPYQLFMFGGKHFMFWREPELFGQTKTRHTSNKHLPIFWHHGNCLPPMIVKLESLCSGASRPIQKLKIISACTL
jgi:hypothetical protein